MNSQNQKRWESTPQALTAVASERPMVEENALLWKVYRWMTIGLVLTGMIAYLMPLEAVIGIITGHMLISLLIGELLLVNLSGVGSFAMMGLFDLIIASVVNLFWANSTRYWVSTCAGVLVFTLLTAFDTQKIKRLGGTVDENTAEGKKLAILGALILYLDFINMFLYRLRRLGKRK